MTIVQLILYCLLFTGMVKLAVRGGAINIGLTTQDAVDRKRRRFMVLFYLVMLAALLLIIGFWNKATDYKTAYLQSLLFWK